MAKSKNFREWVDSDWEDYQEAYSEDEAIYKKKDNKRRDFKKQKIQNARKRKAKEKNSFFDD